MKMRLIRRKAYEFFVNKDKTVVAVAKHTNFFNEMKNAWIA